MVVAQRKSSLCHGCIYCPDLHRLSRVRIRRNRLFKTLLILLDYHNSRQFYSTLHLQAAYNGELIETAREKFSELEDLFLALDAARDYLKTLWVQRELAELSRMLLYTGIPAVLVAAIPIFSYREAL